MAPQENFRDDEAIKAVAVVADIAKKTPESWLPAGFVSASDGVKPGYRAAVIGTGKNAK